MPCHGFPGRAIVASGEFSAGLACLDSFARRGALLAWAARAPCVMPGLMANPSDKPLINKRINNGTRKSFGFKVMFVPRAALPLAGFVTPPVAIKRRSVATGSTTR